jgi:FixJ family two-component response regulator
VNNQPTVFIVDGDRAARRALSARLQSMQLPFEAFASAREFLDSFDSSRPGCLLLDVGMPGLSGLELLRRLGQQRIRPPVIFISADADVPTVVRAMKAGALDFLEKSCSDQQLREAIQEALKRDADDRTQWERTARIQRRIAQLTSGERDVLKMLVQGKSNKTMAELLELSVRTIEVRRAKVMQKMKAGSLAELVRLALLAGNSSAKPQALFGKPHY